VERGRKCFTLYAPGKVDNKGSRIFRSAQRLGLSDRRGVHRRAPESSRLRSGWLAHNRSFSLG
jgi:hypothetical protein